MKSSRSIYIFLFILLAGWLPLKSHSQILISILLGDKLNTGAIEFGLTGGLNRTYMFQVEEAKGLNNFNLGFYFDFRLKEDRPWYIYTGVLVKSEMGAGKLNVYDLDDMDIDTVMVGGHVNRYVSYFNVPISIKHRFKSNIYVLGGFQVSLRYKARDEFTNKVEDEDDLVYKLDTRDEYRRIDAGVTAGLGYKFRYGMMANMGVRFYQGFTEIYKNDFKKNYGSVYNSALYVFFEIPIGIERKLRPPKE